LVPVVLLVPGRSFRAAPATTTMEHRRGPVPAEGRPAGFPRRRETTRRVPAPPGDDPQGSRAAWVHHRSLRSRRGSSWTATCVFRGVNVHADTIVPGRRRICGRRHCAPALTRSP